MTAYVDDNEFPKMLFKEGSAPASPAAGDQALFVDSADHVLKLKNSSGTVSAVSGGSLTSTKTLLGSDVTMTSANTFYDGPSVSLAAGTWLLNGSLQITTTSAGNEVTIKLWDGTTVAASAEMGLSTTYNSTGSYHISALVSPGTTTSYKLSAAGTGTGNTIAAAAPFNTAGNNASYLTAVKVS
jgi:hypothetical protein